MAPVKRQRKSEKVEEEAEIEDNTSATESGSGGKKARKSAANEPTFKESEKVYCAFSNQLYLAIIRDVRPANNLKVVEGSVAAVAGSSEIDEKTQKLIVPSLRSVTGRKRGFSDEYAYFVHYLNWAAKWDEWVRVDCLKAVTEETTKECMELKQLALKDRRQSAQRSRKRRSLKHKKGTARKSAGESQPDSESLVKTEGSQSSRDIEGGEESGPGDASCSVSMEESGYEGDLDSTIVEAHVPPGSIPASSKSLVEEVNASESQKDENEEIRESDCETEPEENLDDLDFMELSPGSSEGEEASADAKQASDLTVEDKSQTKDAVTLESEQKIEENDNVAKEKKTTTEPKHEHGAIQVNDVTETMNAQNVAAAPVEAQQKDSSIEPPTEDLGHGGRITEKVCWSNMESPCAIIASPTVFDIALDLTEYLKSETSGKLSEFFIEKLIATFDSVCQSLPASEREASEKIMSSQNLDKFSKVVHCGGVARLIQIMESKALCRRVEEMESQQKIPISDATEADLVDDMRIILEVCKDYFRATKRYFEAKYNFNFGISVPDILNQDFGSSESNRPAP